jgi:hypothetical protein
METVSIMKEIASLPLVERMLIVENTIRTIREETTRTKSLSEGARALLDDYQTDKELLAFTALDAEKFYEAK